MKNKKTTRRALLSSALSLVLCMAMLIGTTFAWFTDSVTSGRNKIQSGNLDVELYYATSAADVEAGNWNKVTSNTDIFGYDLWEPGYTKVAYFKVVNEGSLALKYQLTAGVYEEIPGTNKAGESFLLSDYIKTALVDTNATRDSILAMDGTALKNSFAMGEQGLAAKGKGTSEAVVGLAIWMPTTVGNEANHDGTNVPSINFGINLIATQDTVENDSFGNTYDADAKYPAIAVAYVDGTKDTPIQAEEVTVTVPAGADAGSYKLGVSNKEVETDVAGETEVSFDISLLKDDVKVSSNGTKYEIALNIGKDLTVSAVTHNGNPVNPFEYNADTGIIKFETDSFSPFSVVYKNKYVASVDGKGYENFSDAFAAADGKTVKLNSNILLDGDNTLTVAKGKNITVDLAGNTITAETDGTGNRELFLVKGNLTVKGGTINLKHVGANMGWNSMTTVFDVTDGGVLNISNATVENLGGSDMSFCVHLNNWGEVTLNAQKVTFKSPYVGIRVFNSGYDMNNVTLTNCNIETGNACFWVHNYTEADFGGADKAAAAAKRLNFEFKNTKISRAEGSKKAVRLGMTDAIYYSDLAMTEVVVENEKVLNWALANGKNVFLNSDVTMKATGSNAYGKTGISIEAGQTFDGNGKTFKVTGAGGTWDSAINVVGGTIKNVTIAQGFRGIFVNHTAGERGRVLLENVIIDGPTYTISCDQAEKQGLTAKNCTINGWTSYAATIGDVVFEDCNFGKGAGYAFCRPYAPTEFVGCDFAEGYKVDPSAAVTFENCTIGGVALTAENVSKLVTSTSKVTIK